MEEVEQTQEEELTAATEVRQEFRALLKSPAWARLVKVIEAQAEQRLSDVLSPASGLDTLVKMEYEKGVRAGMLMIARLPHSIVESLDQDIEELSHQVGDEENG
jgi:hypothetical protein